MTTVHTHTKPQPSPRPEADRALMVVPLDGMLNNSFKMRSRDGEEEPENQDPRRRLSQRPRSEIPRQWKKIQKLPGDPFLKYH